MIFHSQHLYPPLHLSPFFPSVIEKNNLVQISKIKIIYNMVLLDFSGKMVTSSRKISNPYWDTEKTTMMVMLELASSIVHFCKPSTGEACNTAKMKSYCAFSSWPNSRKMLPSSSQFIIGELIYYFIFETKMLIEKLKAIWTLFKHVTVVTIYK